MTRTEIENAIVKRLQHVMGTRVHVAPSPNNPDDWRRLGVKGCILVRYMGSRRADANPRNSDRTMRWHTYSGVKDLRPTGKAHLGAYDLVDHVEATLNGYVIDERVDNRLVLLCDADAYYQEINNVWWYVTEFTTNPYKLTLPTIR